MDYTLTKKKGNILMQNFKFLFSRDSKCFFIISIIVGVINHFYLFTHEVMAPDALYFGTLRISSEWEASLGRWAIQYIDSIRAGLVNPFLISMCCIICVALSSLILAEILNIKNRSVKFWLTLIMMLAPQMSVTLMYTYTADSYALALLLSCISIYILSKDKLSVIEYIISAICIIFALGLYQAYVGVMVGILFLLLIRRLVEDDELADILFWFIKTILFILVCLVLYYLYTKFYLKVNDLGFASYKGADSLGVGLVFELPNTIKKAYLDFFDFLFGERILNNEIWNRNIINFILSGLIGIKFVRVLLDKKLFKEPIRCILLALGVLLFPVGINVMDLIMPQTNIDLVTGYGLILWYLILLLLMDVSKDVTNKISKVVLGILCFTFLMSNNASYMARHDIFLNYYAETSRILTKVEALENYSSDMQWMFSDNIRYESKYSAFGDGFISSNYMTWNEPKGIWLNQQFYDKYLGEKITLVSHDRHNEILQSEEFLEMPIYPENGSIKIIEDVVVIKFSETGSYVE